MTPLTDDEFFDYLAGRLDSERSAEIERAAKDDPELAARIDVMRVFLDSPDDVTPRPSPGHADILDALAVPKVIRDATKRSLRHGRRFLMSCSVLVAVTVLLGAGWMIFSEPALLRDDFDDGWFDRSHWQRPPDLENRSGVIEQDGVMRLINRGYLITNREYPGPIELSFDWKWLNHGLNPAYADHLTVVLRTNGTPRSEYPFEAAEGIRIKIDAWGGNVSVCRSADEHVFVMPVKSVIPLPPDVWQTIRITDTGNRIEVFIIPRGGPAPETRGPLVSIDVPNESGPRQIAIYNREYVSETLHESWLDNFVLKQLRQWDE